MLDGSYLPPGFVAGRSLEYETIKLAGETDVRRVRMTPELAIELCHYLKDAGRRILSQVSVDTVVDVLDKAAAEWLEDRAPDFDEVLDALVLSSGLSRKMVRESLGEEQSSSRGVDIHAALVNEFGDPRVLDGYTLRPDVRALVRAVGPSLTFCVLPGNIPGLSHLSYMRTLLVKSPCLGKTASDESIYAAAYCRTIARSNPQLGECIAAVYWPGGNAEFEDPVFDLADAVIVYGTNETCSDVASRIGPLKKMVMHSHKLGFALVSNDSICKNSVQQLAKDLAYDVAMFDQQACLSPHWIFIEEGAEIDTPTLATKLAEEMREVEKRLPRGKTFQNDAVAVSRTYDDLELAEMLGEPVKVCSDRSNDRFLIAIDDRKPPLPSCLGRTIRLIHIPKLEDISEVLADYIGLFQNVAVRAEQQRRLQLAETFAHMGVARVCDVGQMANPTMMWHHDGMACLSAMVKYCDLDDER